MEPLQLAVILSTTRLVGVKCPGLRSIFSEVTLSKIKTTDKSSLCYEVTKYDKRFGLVLMKWVAPEMEGTIEAFRRPAPVKQSGVNELEKIVYKEEFSGQKALVIGASRGLGEVVSKMLSSGSADVLLTYNNGKNDASNVVDDINSKGFNADYIHFDVLNPNNLLSNILEKNWTPTHLYYFATPFIFSGVKSEFSNELFRKFCDFYVAGFINTFNQLKKFGIKHIFYPSTIFIDEIPLHMGEYSAAKIASEMVCSFLEKADPSITVYKPRLPRVATDQTVSIMPVKNQDPVPVLLRELRSFCA